MFRILPDKEMAQNSKSFKKFNKYWLKVWSFARGIKMRGLLFKIRDGNSICTKMNRLQIGLFIIHKWK